MTVFNGEKYLAKSISSVLQQTFSNFEFIIVNDGSTDATLKILREFNDSRIKIINSQHIGRCAALNLAIAESNTDLIAIQDCDDISHEKRLERQYQCLTELGNKNVISSWYAVFQDKDINYIVNSQNDNVEIKKKLSLTCHFPNACAMFSKKVFYEVGGYGNVNYGLEDYDLYLRIKNKVSFYVIPEVLLFYRSSKDSLSNINYTKRINLQYEIQKPYFKNASHEFGFNSECELFIYSGWREYSCGDKSKAREYWSAMGSQILHHPRILIAFIVSFLPERQFIIFKESRLRFRLQYYLTYFSRISRNARVLLRTYTRIESSQ